MSSLLNYNHLEDYEHEESGNYCDGHIKIMYSILKHIVFEMIAANCIVHRFFVSEKKLISNYQLVRCTNTVRVEGVVYIL